MRAPFSTAELAAPPITMFHSAQASRNNHCFLNHLQTTMRLSKITFAFVAAAFSFAKAAPPPGRGGGRHPFFGNPSSNPADITVGPVECDLHLIEPYMINVTDDEVSTTVCVLDAQYELDGVSGITYELNKTSFEEADPTFFQDVEYGSTTLTLSAASINRNNGRHGGGYISMQPGATANKENRGNGGGGQGQGQGLRGGQDSSLFDRRRLAQTTGVSTLIVLYAVPPDASNNDRNSIELANDIFGINATGAGPQDPVNARSQVIRCSKGQLEYVPATGHPLIVNGILEVPISQNVAGVASGTVKNWVAAAAVELLNSTFPDSTDLYSFTQIMHVIPDEASWGGAAAWAYLPGQTSAFRDSYSYRMGVQVHEFGHNLGLHHSGSGTASYADHSCLMGNPSYGDDGPEICWNGPKSWESGWYAEDAVLVQQADMPFSAELIGVADWSEGSGTRLSSVDCSQDCHKVVLRIEDSTEAQAYHVIYNRAKGPNVGVTFAKDQVTVAMGASRQVSWHQAGHGAPNPATNDFPVFRKANYNGGSKDLVVKVCNMTSEGTVDSASVLVYLDDGPGYNNGEMCTGEVPCLADSDCDDGNWCTQNACDITTKMCIPPIDISATQCDTCGDLTFCNPAGYCDPVCGDDGNWCTLNTCNTTTNTCELSIDISATQCDTCGDLTFCNPTGYCEQVCDDKNPCSVDSCVSDTCQHDPIPGCAIPGARLETWLGISGNSVSHLTGNAAYQSAPDETATIQSLLKTPVNRADNFGARLTTYLTPLATGNYTFWVASDDSSELWLSTDENPMNKVLIASVNGYTSPDQFTKFSSQKSSLVSLTAGSTYYLEGLYKEGGGGDHLSIAWNSSDAEVPFGIIDGDTTAYFWEYPPVPCTEDSQCISTDPCTNGQCNMVTTLCEYAAITGCENGATLETWLGISGSSLTALDNDPRYPLNPNTTVTLTNLLETATNQADNYGCRLQTYITPPVTCNYTFYMASDDAGELNLSTDTNPSNKARIAYINAWAGSRDWYKYTSQMSAPIHLEKGSLYYLESRFKEGGGGDNLAIAWECMDHDIALEVIDASHTAVSVPQVTKAPTRSPTNSPTSTPTASPMKPTMSPTFSPFKAPSKAPSRSPTSSPTNPPSSIPTDAPSSSPTHSPSKAPSTSPPTNSPSTAPTSRPTAPPSTSPTFQPTDNPTTAHPSKAPSGSPTNRPTTGNPTSSPTGSPSKAPSQSPSASPSKQPSSSPTDNPSNAPSKSPSKQPSSSPSVQPTLPPTAAPSQGPSVTPSKFPTSPPTTAGPTKSPTSPPTDAPTFPSAVKYICGKNDTPQQICDTGTAAGDNCQTEFDTSNCGGQGAKCQWATCSGGPPQPTNAPTPNPTAPPTPTDGGGGGGCSSTNCSACSGGGECRGAGCSWSQGSCS